MRWCRRSVLLVEWPIRALNRISGRCLAWPRLKSNKIRLFKRRHEQWSSHLFKFSLISLIGQFVDEISERIGEVCAIEEALLAWKERNPLFALHHVLPHSPPPTTNEAKYKGVARWALFALTSSFSTPWSNLKQLLLGTAAALSVENLHTTTATKYAPEAIVECLYQRWEQVTQNAIACITATNECACSLSQAYVDVIKNKNYMWQMIVTLRRATGDNFYMAWKQTSSGQFNSPSQWHPSFHFFLTYEIWRSNIFLFDFCLCVL